MLSQRLGNPDHGGVMQTSEKGLDLIKAHEGLRMTAYLCPANVWTIGYGHTSAAGAPTVKRGDIITRREAEDILRRDLAAFENGVKAMVTVPLTQGQFDALASFAFNVGLGALRKSTLLRKLNAGRHADVPAELMKWTKGGGRELPGLVRRRREEVALWRSLDATATAGKADVARIDPPAPSKTMAQSKTGNTAVATGAAGALVVASQAKDGAEAVRSVSDSIGIPVLIVIGIVIVCAAAFIWWDRRRKLVEEGV